MAKVTMHAALRFVERVLGEEVPDGLEDAEEKVRLHYFRKVIKCEVKDIHEEILSDGLREKIDAIGTGMYKKGDFCYVVRGKHVITVIPVKKNERKYGSYGKF